MLARKRGKRRGSQEIKKARVLFIILYMAEKSKPFLLPLNAFSNKNDLQQGVRSLNTRVRSPWVESSGVADKHFSMGSEPLFRRKELLLTEK
jgi:hypothetical protein